MTSVPTVLPAKGLNDGTDGAGRAGCTGAIAVFCVVWGWVTAISYPLRVCVILVDDMGSHHRIATPSPWSPA
jgi:hypothetical protein